MLLFYVLASEMNQNNERTGVTPPSSYIFKGGGDALLVGAGARVRCRQFEIEGQGPRFRLVPWRRASPGRSGNAIRAYRWGDP